MQYMFGILEAHWITQCWFCWCYLKTYLKLPQPSVQSIDLNRYFCIPLNLRVILHERKCQLAVWMSWGKCPRRNHLCCTDERTNTTDDERNRIEDSGRKRGWQMKSPARLLTLTTKLVPNTTLNNLRHKKRKKMMSWPYTYTILDTG